MSGKTYRVPKKVHEAARSALTQVGVSDLDSGQAIHIAHALTSGMPVGPSVLFAIHDYFFDHVSESEVVSEAMLHGGRHGREWANRSIALTVAPSALTAAVEAEAEEESSFEEDFLLSDEAVDRIIAFGNELAKQTGVETSLPKSADELAMGSPDDLEAESDDPVDELGEHVETALGLATQLDETIEKLSNALDEALAQTPEDEDEPEVSETEMSMVTDALSEVGADLEDADADFAVVAAEAKERMAAAALVRERSQAMARMASARLTLQAEAPAAAPTEEKAAEPSADAGPKVPGTHHASRQARDWHGRFAKVGGRVRGKGGNLGYVKEIDQSGNLVITGDDGQEHTVDPKEVEVVTKKSPARLPEPMELIEDPKARLEAYQEWAKEQMGVSGSKEPAEPEKDKAEK